MMKRPLLTCALVLLATACSGPSTRINATLREFPQKVRLKAATVEEAPIAPLPPTAPPLTGGLSPIPIAPLPDAGPGGLAPTTTAVTAPPVPCPTAGLGTTALLAAGTSVKAPPPAATYTYRTVGKHVVGGSQARTEDYASTSTRTVERPTIVQGPAGGVAAFTYDVRVVLGSNRTITSYRVIPDGGAPVPGGLAPGLYITAMRTEDASGRGLTQFQPSPAMLLLPFPADQGATFNVASTDPATGTTMAYSGAVGEHARVDACGQVIDARNVNLNGSVVGRSCGTSSCASPAGSGQTSTADFAATYSIATQYGGLSVEDKIAVKGAGLGNPFVDELSGTINSVPAGGVE